MLADADPIRQRLDKLKHSRKAARATAHYSPIVAVLDKEMRRQPEAVISEEISQTMDLTSSPSRVSDVPPQERGWQFMPLENRNLLVGTRLVANYKRPATSAQVEAAGEGEEGLAFVLEDGKPGR